MSRTNTVRLADLLAALSVATDLGLGQPIEHIRRSTLLAMHLSEAIGLGEQQCANTYYVSLLAWVGCSVGGFREAALFGEDIEFRAGTYEHDRVGLPIVLYLLRKVGSDRPPIERARMTASFVAKGPKHKAEAWGEHCETARIVAGRLGLGSAVCDPLDQIYERWDGKGFPNRLRGEQLDVAVRVMQLSEIVEVFHRTGGIDAAIDVARERRGGQFDPSLVDAFCSSAHDVFAALDRSSDWTDLIDAQPGLDVALDGSRLDESLEAIADLVDLKSPYTTGHSRAVADLASTAAVRYGLNDEAASLIRRAGLVHDLGHLGIPNTIWDKQGPLTSAEWERVRLHPYLTERVLTTTPSLAEIGSVAALHHERLDGSGYHRGLTGSAIPPLGRILAAAEVYQASREPRPHRPPLTAAEAEDLIRTEVRSGRLEGAAADAVLSAAGHRVPRRPELPHGLTAREGEVLMLLARGLSNKQVAERLSVSPKTVGTHVEHLYTKLGVRTRAGATLFAMQVGLISGDVPEVR
jgi:HD-GYP domain-containing protein (c-di-GMP phosphodiesterase class II)